MVAELESRAGKTGRLAGKIRIASGRTVAAPAYPASTARIYTEKKLLIAARASAAAASSQLKAKP